MTQPLKKLAPTLIPVFSECHLRGVWSAAHSPQLLPSSPAAHLGSIVHRLLEEAGQGAFGPDQEDRFASRWQELVSEAEKAMLESSLNRRFVPLRDHLPQLEVMKIRTISRALELSQSILGVENRVKEEAPPIFGCEMRVESSDGLIAGKIDRVIPTASGPIIQDYKSGTLYKKHNNQRRIKPEYVLQLRLYAALYHEATGVWPHKLELVPLIGSYIEVPFSPGESINILNEARNVLIEVDETLQRFYNDWEKAEEILAMPSPSACKFCTYRPACSPYLSREINCEDDKWPSDFWGSFDSARRVGNGRLILSVTLTNGLIFYLRDITDEFDKDVNILALDRSFKLGVFNARRTSLPFMFEEGQLTIIYKDEEKSSQVIE